MSRYLCNTPENLDQIRDFISTTLNVTYGKQPANIVFVCGDAHGPGGGAGAELDICNQIAEWILEDRFAPYCSARMCLNQISLHLECGNKRKEIQDILRGANIDRLRELGLVDENVLGWEPIGFANLGPIMELMEKEVLSEQEQGEVFMLINQSNSYFRSVGEEWTEPVITSLEELGHTVPLDQETRITAALRYQNTLLEQRINANMALAASMNRSVLMRSGLFVHFISVGNAHIVEGETIINGIEMTASPNVVGISVGRTTT